MNAIKVDDGDNIKFVSELYAHLDCNRKQISFTQNPFEIAKTIVETVELKPFINFEDKTTGKNLLHIFINIEGKFGGAKRQDQAGAEIAKWLRCKYHVSNPIIFYSFQSVAQLLKQKPENLIITSEGCYHLQLPFEYNKISNLSFTGLKDWEKFKTFLKPAFNISQFRHEHANWWGVKCLWDVHKVLEPKIGNYPENITINLNNINNCIFDFIYGYNIIRVNEKVSMIERELENKLIEMKEGINSKISEKNDWEKYLETVTQELIGLSATAKQGYSNSEIRNSYKVLNNDKIYIENLISNFNVELEIQNLQNNIQNLKRELKTTIFNNKAIPSVVRNKKILIIDDMLKFGWLDAFELLFKHNIIIPVHPDKKYEGKPNELFKYQIQNIIKKAKPDLILLDLRLFDERDKSIEIDKISGEIILEKIKKNFIGIPVIITTASNKIWSFEKLMKVGADGYWIKEGIDEQRDFNNSVDNYLKLLNLINNASGKEYQFLNIFATKFSELLKKHDTLNFWWEQHNWYSTYYEKIAGNEVVILPALTSVNKKIIRNIIE